MLHLLLYSDEPFVVCIAELLLPLRALVADLLTPSHNGFGVFKSQVVFHDVNTQGHHAFGQCKTGAISWTALDSMSGRPVATANSRMALKLTAQQ